MSVVLSCQNISKSFSTRNLFSGLSLSLDDDERVGLIGPNGSGKSTLLRILSGLETPDDGEVIAQRALRPAYLPQEERFDDLGRTVRQLIADAFEGPPEMRERRVGETMGVCGFADPDSEATRLSGGWKKRLAIARLLVNQPEFLLLDEPTNHLDFDGIEWCERLLQRFDGGAVIISHDRTFLHNVCNRIVELDYKYPDGYFSHRGSYADFLERREEYLSQLGAQQASLENRVRREIQWLRQGVKARTTRSESRVKEAHRLMDELQEMNHRGAGRTQSVNVEFETTGRKTRELLVVEGVTKSIGERRLFTSLDVTLLNGVKLGIVGPNGSGKSTFLRLLDGSLTADEGTIRRASHLRVAYFDQHRTSLDPTLTLRRALAPDSDSVVYNGREIHGASWARRFLFRSDQLETRVGELSGGEQSRVVIAKLMTSPADLLILDEPTNDLDIPTLEVLEESLEEFPGALVVVTHDRYLLSTVATSVLGLDGQGGAHLVADFTQWQQLYKQLRGTSTSPRREKQPEGRPKEQRIKLSFQEQRELASMEEVILKAEEEARRYELAAQDPENYGDPFRMREISEQLSEARAHVESLYSRWEELEEKRKLASK
jgi:ABC transport system ATP-binding/permease protein